MTTTGLPPGWTQHVDQSGKTYYYNAQTNQSKWEKPQMVTSLAQQALDNSPWKEHEDTESGKKYYHNQDTNETTWDMPQEYQVLLDRLSTEIKANLLNGSRVVDGPSIIEFKTKEDAEDCFMEMLEEYEVDSSWGWDKVVRRCYSHKMYKALKTVNERKETFERFAADKKERTEKEKTEKYEQDKKLLHKLFSNTDIVGNTKYADMLLLLESHPEFENSGPSSRRKIFDEYVADLRQKEKERARDLRKEQLVAFKELLKTLEFTPSTTWKEAQTQFMPIVQADEKLKGLDMMDALIWFEDFVNTLDSTIRQERQARIRALRRSDRKAREAFHAFLVELRDSKTLHINSKWKELYKLFKDDQRYLDMLGTAGSSAMEMFRDQIMELEDKYMPDRRIIMDTVRGSRFEITTHTTFSEFMSYFKREFRGLSIDHLKLAFEELLHKAAVKLREEKRHQDRKLRKKMDAFKSVLKHLSSPSIKVDDVWASVRDRAKGPEFDALEEDERVEVFGKFLKRLQEKLDGQHVKKKRNRSPSPGNQKPKRTKASSDDDASEEGELEDD